MNHPVQSIVMLAAVCLFAGCESAQPAKSKRFADADTNHNGSLSREEISDKIVTEIFEGRDTNKDGKLSRSEWNVPGEERRNNLFREADINHDGVLTLAEAKACGRARGMGHDFYENADTNHDGSVTLKEARAYYASKEGPVR